MGSKPWLLAIVQGHVEGDTWTGGGGGGLLSFPATEHCWGPTEHEDSSTLNHAEEHACKELRAGVDRQVATTCGDTKHSLT